MKDSRLSGDEKEIADMYFKQQKHDNIEQFLHHFVVEETDTDRFIQVINAVLMLNRYSEIICHAKCLDIAYATCRSMYCEIAHL